MPFPPPPHPWTQNCQQNTDIRNFQKMQADASLVLEGNSEKDIFRGSIELRNDVHLRSTWPDHVLKSYSSATSLARKHNLDWNDDVNNHKYQTNNVQNKKNLRKKITFVAVPCRRRSGANMGRLDFEVDRYAYNPQTPRLKQVKRIKGSEKKTSR